MRTPLQIALESAASTGKAVEREYCFFHLLDEDMMAKLLASLADYKFHDISESPLNTGQQFDGKARIRRYITDDVSTYEYTIKYGRSGDAVVEENFELSKNGYMALLSTTTSTTVRRRYEIPYHDVTKTRKDGKPLVWELDLYIDRTTLTYSSCVKIELEYDEPPADDVSGFIPYEYKDVIVPRLMTDVERAFMDDMYSTRWNVHGVTL